ncbi:MAG: hypothetical protein KAI63_02720 [Planctomycetes bacterium]|nr:hypothetical protein [Planctomycetota bacterium]
MKKNDFPIRINNYSNGPACRFTRRSSENKGGRAGLTLLETLLASVLIAVVGLAVYHAYWQGTNVWRRVQGHGQQKERVIIFLERFSQELRNTFVFQGIPFEGKKKKMSFAGLIKEWDESTNDYIYKPGRSNYEFDSGKKVLKGGQFTYSQLSDVPDSSSLRPELENILEVDFTYYPGDPIGEGLESWDALGQLPAAVRIRIKWPGVNNEVESVEKIITLSPIF